MQKQTSYKLAKYTCWILILLWVLYSVTSYFLSDMKNLEFILSYIFGFFLIVPLFIFLIILWITRRWSNTFTWLIKFWITLLIPFTLYGLYYLIRSISYSLNSYGVITPDPFIIFAIELIIILIESFMLLYSKD